MTLFVQNDAGLAGTGSVSALDASVDVGTIGDGDVNIGFDAVAGRPELEQVVYAVQAQTGPPPDRLFELVNTNFGVNPDNIDIVIIAGGAGFALNDGTLLTVVGGTSLEPNATFGGIVFNPSDSIVVLYDITQNGGNGFCAKPESGAGLTLQTPNSVILYHELSHARRQALGGVLDTTEPDCNNASPEESAAITDENDMRDQLGIGRRDSNNHCGAACSGGSNTNCCIVATIATGSPYSKEVSELREVRDRFLRSSRVGLEFFDRLHDDYYAFSPQVCRMMASSPHLRDWIGARFVHPLTCCLALIRQYAMEGLSRAELGRRLVGAVDSSPELSSLTLPELEQAEAVLGTRSGAKDFPAELGSLLERRAMPSEPVRWALVDTLEMFADALRRRLQGVPAEEIGERFCARIDSWAARLPISDAWNGLSNRAFREELEFLRDTLMRSRRSRTRFARRLPESVRRDHEKARILQATGFAPRSVKP